MQIDDRDTVALLLVKCSYEKVEISLRNQAFFYGLKFWYWFAVAFLILPPHQIPNCFWHCSLLFF